MKPPTQQALHWSMASIALGLILPSLIIFCLEIFVGRIPPLTSITDILRRQFAEGHNLFLIAAFGLIPFAALSVVCFVAARWLHPPRLRCVALGGLLGILLLMVPAHVSVWYPLYGPGRMSSTAVIAFLFIPFYCLATLGVGLLLGWLISRHPHFHLPQKKSMLTNQADEARRHVLPVSSRQDQRVRRNITSLWKPVPYFPTT